MIEVPVEDALVGLARCYSYMGMSQIASLGKHAFGRGGGIGGGASAIAAAGIDAACDQPEPTYKTNARLVPGRSVQRQVLRISQTWGL